MVIILAMEYVKGLFAIMVTVAFIDSIVIIVFINSIIRLLVAIIKLVSVKYDLDSIIRLGIQIDFKLMATIFRVNFVKGELVVLGSNIHSKIVD